MKHAPALRGPDFNSAARHCSSALLTVAIAGLLNACGGEAELAATSGGVPATCVIGGAASAVVTWDAVTGATGYRVYYGTAAGTYLPPVYVQGGATTTYTVTGLSSGTYYFAATTYDSLNESQFSNVVCKTIP